MLRSTSLLLLLLLLAAAVSAQQLSSLPAYQCVPVDTGPTEEPTQSSSGLEALETLSALHEDVGLLSTQLSSLRQQVQAMSAVLAEVRDAVQQLEAPPTVGTGFPVPGGPDSPLITPPTPPPVTFPTTPSITTPTAPPIPRSCQEAAALFPDRPSGQFLLNTTTTLTRVTCDFDIHQECGGERGWQQVAFLNMSDPSHHCPPAWTPFPGLRSVRLCGRINDSECNEVPYSTHGVPYTEVCGRVVAYAYGTPNAFEPSSLNPERMSVEDPYIDGVVVTKGRRGSRQHVWSFVAGLEESPDSVYVTSNCPCSRPGSNSLIPSFVGGHYFCEAGSLRYEFGRVFLDDPLWDGAGCTTSSCCSLNNPPWFRRSLASSADSLHVGLCGDATLQNEDTPIELVQLYVQ